MSNGNGTDPFKKLAERYFPNALAEVAQLMEHGATCHPHDLEWLDHPAGYHIDHADNHVGEYCAGTVVDLHSGQTPLAHAATRLLMALEVEKRRRKELSE